MSEEQMIPLSRLNEVIAQRDALRQEAETLRGQLTAAQREREEERTAMAQQHETGVGELRQQVQALTQQFQDTNTALQQERVGGWRLRAATEAGIDPRLADRLRGDDYDAMLADAQALREALPAAVTPGQLPRANGTRPAPATEQQMKDPAWVRENTGKLMGGN